MIKRKIIMLVTIFVAIGTIIYSLGFATNIVPVFTNSPTMDYWMDNEDQYFSFQFYNNILFALSVAFLFTLLISKFIFKNDRKPRLNKSNYVMLFISSGITAAVGVVSLIVISLAHKLYNQIPIDEIKELFEYYEIAFSSSNSVYYYGYILFSIVICVAIISTIISIINLQKDRRKGVTAHAK